MNNQQEKIKASKLCPGLTSTVKYKIQLREYLDEDPPGYGPWIDYVSMGRRSFDTFEDALDDGAEACVTGHFHGLDLQILRVITTQYVEVANSNTD
jgi:hypothetical protein